MKDILDYSTLLVGTRQGSLLVYTVFFDGESKSHKVRIERTSKAFSKKPILQIEVVPEYHILLSLSDNVVSVHDLTIFTKILTVESTRGASVFAVDLQKIPSPTGDWLYNLRICVAARRRIQFFYWRNRNFHELYSDKEFSDVVKSVTWCDETVCVGTKREYYLVDVMSGNVKDVFPTGSRQQEALVTKLSDSELAVSRDETTVLIDKEGKPLQRFGIKWSDVPQMIVNLPPYLVAALPKYVEIQTIDPRVLIQSIELVRPRLLCVSGNSVFIASTNCVWKLCQSPVYQQIDQLTRAKEFELALRLAPLSEEDEETKRIKVHRIKNLYAFHLFVQHRFDSSLEMFSELETDPSQVIGLFPDLLPSEYRKRLVYPDSVPILEGAELERGLESLITYLLEKRQKLKDMGKKVHTCSIVEGNALIVSKKQLAQIIDTTLLKCYLQTQEALIASLLRLKDNQCHVVESEKILKSSHKYLELILLYESKGMHKEALEFLLAEHRKLNSVLHSPEHTIAYLQRLGSKHLDLIFDYACWVLKFRPDDGLKIFTEDNQEVENLPRDKVMAYLDKTCKQLVIPYLEHIIHEWGDKTSYFHNHLAFYYVNRLSPLMDEYVKNLPADQRPARAGEEGGELGELRTRLIFFLETSTLYSPERVLAVIPLNNFFRERAIVLGQMNRHEQSLAVYVHVLQDNKMAESHCLRTYDRCKEGNRDIYIHLLNIYLSPPNKSILGYMAEYAVDHGRVNIEAALDLLKRHANKIDTAKALELLPPATKLKDLKIFLENVLDHQAVYKRRCQLLRSLHFSEYLQVQRDRIRAQGVKFEVRNNVCAVCNERIGTSAFARYPNGIIVHYCCYENPYTVDAR
ncbi:DgyrCDS2533 [Dimorphilus gyrociliatus]|uniref:DgyrCDS2533 n=1 Tax=Dimorphilus gyrociliatus TaxID=2664684 RepID=A0A7I8VAL1_9ANNE|nr:DgyrCDS2533 [Dimorphilus gyrociliatus]